MTALSPLIALSGPTASGKSSLALALAQRFGGEILYCDSVAVYRGFEIGADKPSSAQRALAPHHMLDLSDPDQSFSAGDYLRLGRAALAELSARARLPIVAGGTGLYLDALLEGLFEGPPRSEALRARLRRLAGRGRNRLHRLLTRLDPDSSARIHANDLPKLTRAVEVCLASRRPLSELHRLGRNRLEGYRVLRLGLCPPRPELYARIDRRAAQMFADGLVEETRRLLERFGDESKAPAMRSLGYRQAAALLRGELDLPTAVAEVQKGHRNYAKRQLTWFRRSPEIHWLEGFGSSPAIAAEACRLVESFLRAGGGE